MVFRGRAVSAREYPGFELEKDEGIIYLAAPQEIVFDVTTLWKGHRYETIYLTTNGDSQSCGYQFFEGIEYIVYSNSRQVTWCSRTQPIGAAAEDLAELGEGEPPVPGTISPTPDVSGRLANYESWVRERAQRSDGCGLAPGAVGLSSVGIAAVIAWLIILRRRRSDRSVRDRGEHSHQV